jgi:hypothetical protein
MKDKPINSTNKMRVGVFLIFLWWFPFWMLATSVAEETGFKLSAITILIMGIQTMLGLLGFYIVGKPITKLIKQLPFKQVPSHIWYMLIHGKEKPTN